jgi:hypothetical protein
MLRPRMFGRTVLERVDARLDAWLVFWRGLNDSSNIIPAELMAGLGGRVLYETHNLSGFIPSYTHISCKVDTKTFKDNFDGLLSKTTLALSHGDQCAFRSYTRSTKQPSVPSLTPHLCPRLGSSSLTSF